MNKQYHYFAYYSLLLLGLVDNIRGVIYPDLLELFELKNSTGSYIFSLTSFISFVVTSQSRRWLKKFDSIFSTKASFVFHFACLLSLALSSKLADYGLLLVFSSSAFLGIAIGIQSVTLNLIVANYTSPTESRKIFSALHSMYALSSFSAPLFISIGLSFQLSWNQILLLMSVLPIFFLLHSWSLKESHAIKMGQHHTLGQTSPKKIIYLISLCCSLYVATEMLVATRLTLYLREIHLTSSSNASYALSLFFVFLFIGRASFSRIRISISNLDLLRISMASSLVFFILGLHFHPFFLVLIGLSFSYFFPCCLDFIKMNFEDSANIISTVMTFVGGAIIGMHMLFGIIAQYLQVDRAMIIGVVLIAIVLNLLQILKKSMTKSSSQFI